MRRQTGEEVWYGIHEVYYSEDGRPIACSEEAVRPYGESPEELRNDVRHFSEALEKPVLDYDDIGRTEKGL
jgi:hypothetical protein